MRISKSCFTLPNPLLLLLLNILQAPSLPVAQGQTIQLDRISAFSITSTQKSLNIAIPQSTQPIVLSVELCTQVDGQQNPKFFASANTGTSSSSTRSSIRTSASASSTPGVVADDGDQVQVDTGLGTWTSPQALPNGGVLKVELDQNTRSGTWRFSVGVSTNAQVPLHSSSLSIPLYGDATGTSALLFSGPIPDTAIPFQEPASPRYELPGADLSPPNPPDSAQSANSTLIILPTSSLIAADGRLTSSLTGSGCFLQALASSAASGSTSPAVTPSLVLRNQAEGWRTQFVVDGLQPSTNYTFYTLTTKGSGTSLSGPAYFKTKSTTFSCSLVHSLPFCPGVAWTAPFPPLAAGATTYDSSNFPTTIQQMVTQSLGNFTASLKTFPCGREIYSIIQSCASCERAYRNWLCSVLIPRCGEVDPSLEPPAALVARSVGSENTTSTFARLDQTVFSTGNAITDYMELLPCLETCQAVDRACPPNIEWTCPRKGLNAEKSYGVGFVDQPGDDISGGGREGGGRPGMTQDVYGNVWCNGIV